MKSIGISKLIIKLARIVIFFGILAVCFAIPLITGIALVSEARVISKVVMCTCTFIEYIVIACIADERL